jgi:two-component system chemotaxis response regulator CheB
MIKVLIVDDSQMMQETLRFILSADPVFHIVGYAVNGEEAIEMNTRYKPDVITMDWQMPKLNGHMATQKIMSTNPTPIVVVTGSLAANDVTISFSLMEAGALAIVKKPHGISHPLYKKETQELIQTLKLMSEVKLVKRTISAKDLKFNAAKQVNKIGRDTGPSFIAIGASTGGPIALQKLLSNLQNNFPVPILIVQHISKGFVNGFIEWLMNTTNIPIHLAYHGEIALPGHVYVAPDDHHMGIAKGLKITLNNSEKENNLRPSVSYLFRSCAENYGSSAIGVLLSGMGRDGADELKLMRDHGSITFVQDEKSSIVFGMPGEAVKLGAATEVLPPKEIAIALNNLIFNTKK